MKLHLVYKALIKERKGEEEREESRKEIGEQSKEESVDRPKPPRQLHLILATPQTELNWQTTNRGRQLLLAGLPKWQHH